MARAANPFEKLSRFALPIREGAALALTALIVLGGAYAARNTISILANGDAESAAQAIRAGVLARIEALAADVHTFVRGRKLDDNAHVLLRYEGGAKGMLWCSQVAVGQENGLRLRVYGTKGGLEWAQEDPNYLYVSKLGEPRRRITRSGAGAGPEAARVTRIPSGHPEGYLEAFANLYAEAAAAIAAKKAGKRVDSNVVYPTVDDGVKGVAFVEACVASSRRNGAWVKV